MAAICSSLDAMVDFLSLDVVVDRLSMEVICSSLLNVLSIFHHEVDWEVVASQSDEGLEVADDGPSQMLFFC